MKIDKSNGNVKYNDEEHLYWDDNGKFISVTTLIGKFCQPFDSDYWSSYKAIERILDKETFKVAKKDLQNNVNVNKIIEAFDIDIDKFNSAKQDILDEWQRKNIEACERGTKIHADLEHSFTKKKETDMKKYGLGGKFLVNTNDTLNKSNLELLDIDKGVFPEYLIYRVSDDGKFRLAGQIDLLIKDGNDVYIRDYKTNGKIDEKSYYNPRTKKYQMMQYPLNNLMDCTKVHYALQLSTYAWMLQQVNPAFNIKQLMLIHYDHDGNVTEIPVDYLKDDVIRMCKWHKKQVLDEERKNRRKPIEF